MRLEPLFEGTLRYEAATWVDPYGGAEGAGFGTGTGEVTGPALRGSVRWANHPRRRADGVWLPDLHGVIHTDDGADVLIAISGQSVLTAAEPVRRAVTCAVTFKSDDPRWEWLNVVFAVLEGEINEETATVDVRACRCVNEMSS
jgi:hypothetical protein